MKKIIAITLATVVAIMLFVFFIGNFTTDTSEDTYSISGSYIAYSSEEKVYEYLQITTDSDGYVAYYNGETYHLIEEENSESVENKLILTGEDENNVIKFIKILFDFNELTVDIYGCESSESVIADTQVSATLINETTYEYYYYNEKGNQTVSNIEFIFDDNLIQIKIDDKYESDWLSLYFSDYSIDRFSITDAKITAIDNSDEVYYLDFETFSSEYYKALSYEIKTDDGTYIDSNFLVAEIDSENESFVSTKSSLVGYYVNGNGSIDIEVTSDEIYLQVSYLEQYYNSTLLATINLETLVPIIETGSYLTIINDAGENEYLLKIYPKDIDYLTGNVIYQFALYDYDSSEAMFNDSFTKQEDY